MFDSHAHYDDEKLASVADELLTSLFAGEVSYVMNVACDLRSIVSSAALAARFPGKVFCSAGIHPEQCESVSPSDAYDAVKKALGNPACRAIGEIGLDYHYDYPIDRQKELFDAQLCLAEETGTPVIIHDRDAHGDVCDLLRAHKKVGGILHSFSGSAEMAKEMLSLGWYISFSGVVTFKNARKTVEVASVVPDDRMLIETDCPYMAPEPERGRVNHSGRMKYTALKLAEIRGTDFETVRRLTRENARRLYGL